jgi:hypothetical protein
MQDTKTATKSLVPRHIHSHTTPNKGSIVDRKAVHNVKKTTHPAVAYRGTPACAVLYIAI